MVLQLLNDGESNCLVDCSASIFACCDNITIVQKHLHLLQKFYCQRHSCQRSSSFGCDSIGSVGYNVSYTAGKCFSSPSDSTLIRAKLVQKLYFKVNRQRFAGMEQYQYMFVMDVTNHPASDMTKNRWRRSKRFAIQNPNTLRSSTACEQFPFLSLLSCKNLHI